MSTPDTKRILYRSTEDQGHFLWWCPGCDEAHGCWTGEANKHTGSRWTWNGNLEKPTFSPSLLLRGFSRHSVDRVCHCFIHDGNIQYLSDSTHHLAGQTVPMVAW